jgi:hypothetical protein
MNGEYRIVISHGLLDLFLSNESLVMNGEFRIVISRKLLKMSLLGRQ